MYDMLLFVLLICSTMCAGSMVSAAHADDDAAPARITLAAYNIENAFDVFDNPYTNDEDSDVKPREEIAAIGKVLATLDADVIGFSEVENEAILESIAKDHMRGKGYDYIAVTRTNSGRGINLGVMSRLPIKSLTSHRFLKLTVPPAEPDGKVETMRFARDLFKVVIDLGDDRELDVYIVHFKSKRDRDGDPQSTRWRLAEATAARTLIEKSLADDPDRLVAIIGDFNDTPFSKPIEALTANSPDTGKPILSDAHAAVTLEKRITYLREPYRSTIDYIFASPALSKRLIPESAVVPSDAALLTGSDHAPVVASFKLD